MLQDRLRIYLIKERIIRNAIISFILIIVAMGLYLGREGLYEYTASDAQSDTTKYEVQRYSLMTQRRTEEVVMNPRWKMLLADSGKLRKKENGETIDHALDFIKNGDDMKTELKNQGLKETFGKIENSDDLSQSIKKIKGSKEDQKIIEEKLSSMKDAQQGKNLDVNQLINENPQMMEDHPELISQVENSEEILKKRLEDPSIKSLIREREILTKKAKEFEMAIRKGDLEYEAENLFTAEEWYHRAFIAAKEIKSWEACLLIGSRFLTLTKKLHFTGGKPMTAEQCFKEALEFALDKRSADGCRKVAAAMKLINLPQRSEYAEERAREFEKENLKKDK